MHGAPYNYEKEWWAAHATHLRWQCHIMGSDLSSYNPPWSEEICDVPRPLDAQRFTYASVYVQRMMCCIARRATVTCASTPQCCWRVDHDGALEWFPRQGVWCVKHMPMHAYQSHGSCTLGERRLMTCVCSSLCLCACNRFGDVCTPSNNGWTISAYTSNSSVLLDDTPIIH